MLARGLLRVVGTLSLFNLWASAAASTTTLTGPAAAAAAVAISAGTQVGCCRREARPASSTPLGGAWSDQSVQVGPAAMLKERCGQAIDDFDRRGGQVRNQLSQMAECGVATTGGSADAVPVGHRWLLLRHGQTNFNADGRVQGSSDTARLSDEGRRQAQAVGGLLAQLKIDKVFVSPLTRAQETLHEADRLIIGEREKLGDAAGLGVGSNSTRILHDLREVDLHEWEGLYKRQIKEQWPEVYRKWRGESPAELCLFGRYPIRDLWSRAQSVWTRVLSDAAADANPNMESKGARASSLPARDAGPLFDAQERGYTLLMAHNGINQALLATAFGLPENAFRKFEFPNCGVVELVWNPSEATATKWRWIYPTASPWKTGEQTRLEWENAGRSFVPAHVSEADTWDLRGGSTAAPKAECRDWKHKPRRPQLFRVDSAPCMD